MTQMEVLGLCREAGAKRFKDASPQLLSRAGPVSILLWPL